MSIEKQVGSGFRLGAGRAVLFSWLGVDLLANSPWIIAFAATLAPCTVAFFMLIIVVITKESAACSKGDVRTAHGLKSLCGLASALICFGAGLYLLAQLPTRTHMTSTDVMLGASMAGNADMLQGAGARHAQNIDADTCNPEDARCAIPRRR